VVVASLSALVGLPGIARAAGVSIRLRPLGPTSVAQGTAFTTSVTLRNPAPDPVDVTVTLEMVELASGAHISAISWRTSVPAQGSVSSNFPLTSSQWFADLGSFEVRALVDDRPAGALDFEVTAPTVVVPVFQDVTGAAGIYAVVGPSNCGAWAAGAAWGDVDGDGSLDLFLPRDGDPAMLWINDGTGHFTDQAAARGVADGSQIGIGAVFADYDNDGDQDLFVADRRADRLYQNDGTGHFTDVGEAAGVAGTSDDVSAAWGDYDNDGYLDLYVVSNSPCAPPNLYEEDRLLHNEGDGTFTDQTTLLAAFTTLGAGYQAAWFDYDGDGDQDLYLANDRWGPNPKPNHLWRNDGAGSRGPWTFTDVSTQSGTGYSMNSMGIGIGDIDRDLDLDFAISNISGNVLARNNGDGTFTDVAGTVGVKRPLQQAGIHSVTWGIAFADFNLDGNEDLFSAAGSIYDQLDQPNQVFAAAGNGSFLDLSAPSGAADAGIGRGIAIADYDHDGLPDVYVINRDGAPILYRNVTVASGHWLEVRLRGTVSNRDGCGARLTLMAATGRQLRESFCGSVGLSSGDDTVLHFGLGSASTVDRLTIQWPSGRRQVLKNVAADQIVEVTEPT
jgi:hypothetical protein